MQITLFLIKLVLFLTIFSIFDQTDPNSFLSLLKPIMMFSANRAFLKKGKSTQSVEKSFINKEKRAKSLKVVLVQRSVLYSKMFLPIKVTKVTLKLSFSIPFTNTITKKLSFWLFKLYFPGEGWKKTIANPRGEMQKLYVGEEKQKREENED